LTLARLTVLAASALAILAAVPVAAGAKLAGGAGYAGKTADGRDVHLRLSGNARRVARLRIDYKLRCDDGRSGATYTVIMNARLRGKRHSFSAHGRYTGSADHSRNTFRVEGRVSRRSARGTFSLVNVAKSSDGTDGAKCSSGRLRWHAARLR
jgi:hypothetical protein